MSPTTSPYFNSTYPGQTSEQSLVDDLTREQIKIFGLDVIYMPRRHLNMDKLLHESSKAAFEVGLPIPMYSKTVDGFDNGMEILSKFGVRSSDEITMVMSRSEFTTYYSPYLKEYYNSINEDPAGTELDELVGEIATRPKEGDLIFFPFDNSIFEIKYVLFDQPFFQLGTGYVFEIQCEKFEYSGESFSTGYDTVDEPHRQTDFTRMEFDVLPTGTGTFEKGEAVVIYDLTNQYPQGLVTGDGRQIFTDPDEDWLLATTLAPTETTIQTEDGEDILFGEDRFFFMETDGVQIFRLYKDPGFVRRVEMTRGVVMDWDKPASKLVIGDTDEIDPQQQDDDTGDLTINKHDRVLVIGIKSGAHFVSTKVGPRPMPFDDTEVIQEEFDAIKILDMGDENPFGFV